MHLHPAHNILVVLMGRYKHAIWYVWLAQLVKALAAPMHDCSYMCRMSVSDSQSRQALASIPPL